MKPTVPDVLPLVRTLYRRDSAGCCWHSVLDDGNVSDESVAYVVAHLLCGATECAALADLLPRMSRTQRRKLAASTYPSS